MNAKGLTYEEIRRNYSNDFIEKSRDFKTMGINRDAANDYLLTSDGRRYLVRLLDTDSRSPLEVIKERAVRQLTSGRELPRIETIGIDESLVKIVPAGTSPSAYSPFWTKEAELDAAVNGGKNLSEVADRNLRQEVFVNAVVGASR